MIVVLTMKGPEPTLFKLSQGGDKLLPSWLFLMMMKLNLCLSDGNYLLPPCIMLHNGCQHFVLCTFNVHLEHINPVVAKLCHNRWQRLEVIRGDVSEAMGYMLISWTNTIIMTCDTLNTLNMLDLLSAPGEVKDMHLTQTVSDVDQRFFKCQLPN